jgi:hypothetical protein
MLATMCTPALVAPIFYGTTAATVAGTRAAYSATQPPGLPRFRPPPTAPSPSSEAVSEARRRELEEARRRRGFGATILTSPLGVLGAPLTQGKTLLGQ